MGLFEKRPDESWEDYINRMMRPQQEPAHAQHTPMSDEQYRETLTREIEDMGWSLGLVFKAFMKNGFTEEQAFQLTNSYLLRTSSR